MKVLHLINSGGVYGAERMLLSLVAAQVVQGLSPTILCTCDVGVASSELELEAKRLGLPVKAWPMSPGFDLKSCRELLEWAKAENYQILHTHGYKFTVSLGVLKAVRAYPFRFVATFHGYTHKTVLSKGFVYAVLDRLCRAAFFDRTVFVGPGVTKSSVAAIARRQFMVPNGIPVADSPDTKQRGYHVVAIGRLSPEKNFGLLLQAFQKVLAEFGDSFLTIAGDGDEQEGLVRLASQLDIADKVEFKGYVKDVAPLLADANVFVNSSVTEGMPITILEAINAEVPVVATDVGSVSYVFAEGHAYPYLVASGDAEGMADCIKSVLRASGDEMQRLTSTQKARLVRVFSSDAMACGYLAIYRELETKEAAE